MQSFAATSVAAASKLERWNAQLAELFSGLVADPDDADQFDGTLSWNAVGLINGAIASASRCRMYHPAALSSGQTSSFILKLQIRGRSLAEHVGEEALLTPGDLILFDTDKAHRLTLLEDSEMLALSVPKTFASERISVLESLAGISLSRSNPAVRLCGIYAENLWKLSLDSGPQGLPAGSTGILCDLIGMCAPHQIENHHRAHRADWSKIRDYLRERMLEPELSMARISADLGVTSRRLQQIFAEKGTTPGRHVLEHRLKEARRRLADRSFHDQSITDIALGVGFGDITYFGRAFRTRYGTSPAFFRRSLKNN